MARLYGKYPAKGRQQPAVAQLGEIQVNITGRHTIEQLALEVQRALAMVQDYGAAGVERFRFRLLPLDEDAVPKALHDAHGQPVTTINIPDTPPEPVYRENEPGVGFVPVSNSRVPADAALTSPDPARQTRQMQRR